MRPRPRRTAHHPGADAPEGIWLYPVQVLLNERYVYYLHGDTAISCRRAQPDHAERGLDQPGTAELQVMAPGWASEATQAAQNLARRGPVTAGQAAGWIVLDGSPVIWRGKDPVETAPIVTLSTR
jgi:hypothetical protein